VAGIALALLTACAARVPAADEDPAPPAPGAFADPAVDSLDVPTCPPWDAEPTYPDGALPSGAISIRVCPGDKPLSGPPLWQPAVLAPVDALTTGVSEVTASLDALPEWEGLPDGTYCAADGRPKLHYVIGYPGGSTRSVTYGYGSCHLLELSRPDGFPTQGTVAKADASLFMDAVSEGIVEQRRGARPPAGVVPAPPPCVPSSRPYTALPVQELDLGVAALCLLDDEGWRRAVIPPALADRLTSEYAAARVVEQECTSAFTGTVVGWSTWGDPVELQLWGGCAVLGSPWLGEVDSWTMSSELAADLLDLELGPPVAQR
jgi:hypothetical protein